MAPKTYPASAVEISQWVPESVEQIVGNEKQIQYFREALKTGGRTPPTILLGDSRTGKSATIKLFAKILMCEQALEDAPGPCLECDACKDRPDRYGQRGVEVHMRTDRKMANGKIHFVPCDCTQFTEQSIRDLLSELRDYDGLRIVYLDEFHRLARRGLDEMLLKPVEEKNFVWWASAVSTEGIDQMLLNRFCVRLRTEPPTEAALAEWLALRCVAWQLQWDDPQTLIDLADRSGLIPGKALHVLARAAATSDRMVTKTMLDSHDFDV